MREPITGSFTEVVDAFARIVIRNPALAEQYRWPTDRGEQERFIDEREAQRMIAHNWLDFVDEGASPSYESMPTMAEKKTLWRNVVDKGRAMRAAAGTYKEMFGEDGVVDSALAHTRAAICVSCPKNDTKQSLWAWFATGAAEDITAIYEHLHSVNLTTPLDDKLGVCSVCSCPMKAKVWARIEHIRKHMAPDIVAQLNPANPRCWIL